MNRRGITLVELVIALAVVAIAFVALLYSQVFNVQANARSKIASQVKAAANQILEAKMSDVLEVRVNDTSATPAGTTNTIESNSYIDYNNATIFGKTGVKQSFLFNDYYWSCPTVQTPPAGYTGSNSVRTALRSVTCAGSTSVNGITVNWRVAGQSGIQGEGILDVVVTASHSNGISITMGNRVSCYDIYPSPSSDAPKPCPKPYDPTLGLWGGRS